MQSKNQKEKSEGFQMKRLKKKETNMQGTNAITQKRITRELHLELGGDIVTYVRVY